MSLSRQFCWVVVIAIAGGTGAGFTSGSLHEAIDYGVAVLTGALIGLWAARW